MDILETHCELAYLEYIFEKVLWEHIKVYVQATTSNKMSWIVETEGRIDCNFVSNSNGLYDLKIFSKLYIDFNFIGFMKEYCGLSKKCTNYYNKKEEAVLHNYLTEQYNKFIVFHDFTIEDVEALIAFFNIEGYNYIAFKNALHNLVNLKTNYSLDKSLQYAMGWNKNIDKGSTVYSKDFAEITVYIRDKIDAFTAYDWLISKCSEMANYMSPVEEIPFEKHIMWAHEYNYWFKVSLDDRRYLGICHILNEDKRNTTNTVEFIG